MSVIFQNSPFVELAVPELLRLGIHSVDFRYDYEQLTIELRELEKTNRKKYLHLVREISEDDFYFFCFYVLNFPILHPYLMARCYEAQDLQDEKYLFILAARDHWKSVLNSIAMPIWDIIHDPNMTIAILSFQRDKAIGQILSIKQILESNELIKDCWPDIFYRKKQEATKWNLYTGMFVKRSSTVKEASFSAWGLIENSPVSMHFDKIIVDDPVTLDNSATTDQIEKVKSAYKMMAGYGTRNVKIRTITTRYDIADISADLLKDKRYKKIIIPGEVDEEGRGIIGGIPVYKTRQELDDIRSDFGDAYYCGQILQDPTASRERGFDLEWITYYDELPEMLNHYLIIDPAGTKHKTSDFTAMAVIGVDWHKQFFLVDLVRDKIDIYERWEKIKELNKQYDLYDIFYECYGIPTDLDVLERAMQTEKYFIPVNQLNNNQKSKFKRITSLMPEFRKRNFLLPKELYYTDITGVEHELIADFINEEYSKFPNNRSKDDMLDVLSRINDIDLVFPEEGDKKEVKKTTHSEHQSFMFSKNSDTTWMSDFVSESVW